MGSPSFAAKILDFLSKEYPIIGVVTQPDRKSGRGNKIIPSPVKQLAVKLNIPVQQPERLKDPVAFERLAQWEPDMIIVAAFGQILRQNILDMPPLGCVNVHASLLPRWRGAAPIQAAILNGDEQTGVTIMKMDAGIDTGPILKQKAILIDRSDTGESLSEKLSVLGGKLLIDTLPEYLNGSIVPLPQGEMGSSYAPQLTKENGLIDFSQPAEEIERKVRAYFPWPGTFFNLSNLQINVLGVKVEPKVELGIGIRGILNGYPAFGTSSGALILIELQPAGKKPMKGIDFLNGFRGWI